MDDREYPMKFRSIYFQLRAKDLERAKKFYEDVFNFEVTWYMSPEVGWCELRLPGTGSRIGLNALGEGEVADANWGKLTMRVEDLEGAKDYLEGKGGDPTACSVYAYYFLFEEEDARLIELENECRTGALVCGDCKARLAKIISRFLVDFQEKREKAKDRLEDFLIK